MSHPILSLQAMLVAALRADSGLADVPVFDAPPLGSSAPYLAIARHDVVPRDGDDAPGWEHRVLIHVWAGEPSRKAVLALAERVLAVGLGAMSGELVVTHATHERTDTAIDGETGLARAAVAMRFFTEASG
jgi:hypothetical protein